jgi:hypothetical protein
MSTIGGYRKNLQEHDAILCVRLAFSPEATLKCTENITLDMITV